MSDNRDTQFQGFAKLLFEELYEQFNKLYYQEELGTDAGREQAKKDIQVLLARRAYDLVDIAICHIAMQMSNDSAVMFVPRQNAVKYIPDLLELPKEQESSSRGEYQAKPLTWREREDAIRSWKPPIQKEQE